MTNDWLDDAACLGVDISIFYPPKGGKLRTEALALCRSCPVRRTCLEPELAETIASGSHSFGIRGGMTARKRDELIWAQRREGGLPRPIKHGTANGWRTHRLRGEDPCIDCTTAHQVALDDRREQRAYEREAAS